MNNRSFYRLFKERDTDFEALADKYRKKLERSQNSVIPICVGTSLVLFIIYLIMILSIEEPDSSDYRTLLLTPVVGIAIGEWIFRRISKYYQKKFDNARRRIIHTRYEQCEENQRVEAEKRDVPIPPFLEKPTDDFSKSFFGKDMVTVKDEKCRYAIEIYGETAGEKPGIIKTGSFAINESHVYSKKGKSSWYVIQTMKDPSVRTSRLLNSVYAPYKLSRDFHHPEMFLTLPDGKSYDGYASISLHYMGSYNKYTVEKGLDESLVFCHVFRLGDELYKDFILCARKEDYSWRLETIIPAKHQEILPSDYVPPDYFFGSFQIL
ncbi:MAG: hypothetical protein LUH53_11360 [Lachnospiraceae bacterium]|nr:hypothetical protein [Lachnospiraceae bacterium]